MQGDIVDYFAQFSVKMEESWVRKTITNAKVKIAGNTLENVIFKFHFERNFERKTLSGSFADFKEFEYPAFQDKS